MAVFLIFWINNDAVWDGESLHAETQKHHNAKGTGESDESGWQQWDKWRLQQMSLYATLEISAGVLAHKTGKQVLKPSLQKVAKDIQEDESRETKNKREAS